MMIFKTLLAGLAVSALLVGAGTVTQAGMNGEQRAIYDELAVAAKTADPSFAGFSSARGKLFFAARHKGGGEKTPSCTTCHTNNPKKAGETIKTGKVIEPMAASVTPKRYTVRKKVSKWFRRNCADVLGRACTVTEKGDFLAYMLGI